MYYHIYHYYYYYYILFQLPCEELLETVRLCEVGREYKSLVATKHRLNTAAAGDRGRTIIPTTESVGKNGYALVAFFLHCIEKQIAKLKVLLT